MAMFDLALLKEIHHYSAGHRHMIERATTCGCFYCEAIFDAKEVELWCDDPQEGVSPTVGTTALCPRCGIDSVLPDNIPGVPLSHALLQAMREHWF
jgi:hypothetical protein